MRIFLVVFQYVATKGERISRGVIVDVSTLLPSHSGKLQLLENQAVGACENLARTVEDLKGQHLETNFSVMSLMALMSKCRLKLLQS